MNRTSYVGDPLIDGVFFFKFSYDAFELHTYLIVKNNLRGIIVSYLIDNWIALIITFVRRVVIVMCERV